MFRLVLEASIAIMAWKVVPTILHATEYFAGECVHLLCKLPSCLVPGTEPLVRARQLPPSLLLSESSNVMFTKLVACRLIRQTHNAASRTLFPPHKEKHTRTCGKAVTLCFYAHKAASIKMSFHLVLAESGTTGAHASAVQRPASLKFGSYLPAQNSQNASAHVIFTLQLE